MLPFQPTPRDLRMLDYLEGLPLELFTDRHYLACELSERYGLDCAVDLAHRLELTGPLAEPATAAEIAARRGFLPGFLPALGWVLDRLVDGGELAHLDAGTNGTRRYRLERPLRQADLAELRATGLALEPALAAALALYDAAAAAYPAVARGDLQGEQALFGMGQIALWIAYFDNANPVYAINNWIAARAAADRLRPGPGLRILEIGAGAGSASEWLLGELACRDRLGDLALYRSTEPSPFFRRRCERELRARHPEVPFAFAALDIDRPLAEQGLGDERFDLIFGVNVLHVAQDLPAAVRSLGRALAPDAWLVAGECMPLFGGQRLTAELVMEILASFTGVRTDPHLRPRHGFLRPEEWLHLLAACGFSETELVPDLLRVREIYANFNTGALCARGIT